jgi:O-acetyl-ADP-ribose deacetylase
MHEEHRIERDVNGVVVECLVGDITEQDKFDAVVNAANAELRPGGGVAGAIHAVAGPELEADTRPLAPITPGQAVITSGHGLPNRWVIHCLGPVYGRDRPEDELLAACYREALRLTEEKGIKSVAFPAISTGAFGYPVEEAARVALGTVLEVAPSVKRLKKVRFVLHDPPTYRTHARVLAELTAKPG